MKIFHFSDTHGFHRNIEIPECDVIVFSGDESNYREVLYNENEFYDFLTWYGSIDRPHKIMIAGNHSTYISQYERVVRKVCKEANIHYLNKGSVIVEDVKFYGDPLTPTFGDWSFMCKRETINRHWDIIPEDIDVLITHGPPKGILDLSYNRNHELEFCGDGALGKRIKQIPSIKAVLFGHVHDCEGVYNHGLLLRDGVTYSNGTCVRDGRFDLGIVNNGNLIEI